ncbi:hypothetical protein ABZ070_15390, partial [Streptomyces sp. NPDC006283]
MDTTSMAVAKAESADGTLIAYEQRGAGDPLVLVSGALCTAASDAPLAELLAPHRTVFTYDRRGRGASGDTAPYAVEREIEDLAAVVTAAGGRMPMLRETPVKTESSVAMAAHFAPTSTIFSS